MRVDVLIFVIVNLFTSSKVSLPGGNNNVMCVYVQYRKVMSIENTPNSCCGQCLISNAFSFRYLYTKMYVLHTTTNPCEHAHIPTNP